MTLKAKVVKKIWCRNDEKALVRPPATVNGFQPEEALGTALKRRFAFPDGELSVFICVAPARSTKC